jgi:hypothetical protein
MAAATAPRISTPSPSRNRRSQSATRPRRSRSGPGTDRCTRRALTRQRRLGRYRDWRGCQREVVTLPGAGDSLLVLDRDAASRGDRRVLAHLWPDEPPENATLVCRSFVKRASRARCLCRPLRASDLLTVPSAVAPEVAGLLPDASPGVGADHELDSGHRLALVPGTMSIPELRWCAASPGGIDAGQCPQPVSVRAVIASLERYEPVITLTGRALAQHGDGDDVSVAVLRAELARVRESPIVLNRALRAAALDVIKRHGYTMSEIAMRCGRVKRDAAGNLSGETSWLARRLGLLPEGGQRTPTPWIHIDVLALIARDGLGLSPREVEAD